MKCAHKTQLYYLNTTILQLQKLPKLGNFNFIQQFFPSNFKNNCQSTKQNKKYLLPNTSHFTIIHYYFIPFTLHNVTKQYYPPKSFCFEYFFPCIYEMLHHLLNFISFFFAQVLSSSQNFNVQLLLLLQKKILNESCVAPSMIEKIFHFTTVELK